MKKMTILGAVILAVVATIAVGAAQQIPEVITIDAAADKQAAVTFPHLKHTELVDTCVTCHHTQEGLTADSDVKVEACTACHLDPEEGVPGMREMSLKKNPFHGACISCHKEQEKGPTKCTECHPKG